jgi:hypothetical protein
MILRHVMRHTEQLRGNTELSSINLSPQLCNGFRINSIINYMV